MGSCASSQMSMSSATPLFSQQGRAFSNYHHAAGGSLFTQQGRKGVNQDTMLLWTHFGAPADDAVFCGVFDGHGPHGHLVARFVRDELPIFLRFHLPLPPSSPAPRRRCIRFPSFCSSAAPASPDEPEIWKDGFLKSFKAMDKTLRRRSLDCFCSGTTAVTLLKLGMNLYMANVGDSRAVLGTHDESGDGSIVAVQLTVDLKPDLPNEAERIKRCKGRVFALQEEPEVPRVWLPFDDAPGLAMARAFGDFCLKKYGVISVPEFSHWTITQRDQFVILASDGIWDVFSNQEVVDIVASSPSRSAAAKFLVDAASREWKNKYPTSRMDDCTVVCLYLDGNVEAAESDAMERILPTTNSSPDSSMKDSNEADHQGTYLNRNLTVRMDVEDAVHGWSGLEGVTRVNSMVQLPRFSDKKTNE